MLVTDGRKCPVCDSPFVLHVGTVPTIRTRTHVNLFTCMRCQSFWNPGEYFESEDVKKKDVAWGVAVAERNTSAGRTLVERLKAVGVRPSSVAEIGCGIGTVLKVFHDQGARIVGFDVNRFAVEHGRATHGLDLRDEIWHSALDIGKVDLFLCVSVLEHMAEPRPLLQELCRAAESNRAALFVSVPLLNEPAWKFLHNTDPAAPGTPFFDNDVHVTHFSSKGLELAMREFGCTNYERFGSVLWAGGLARF